MLKRETVRKKLLILAIVSGIFIAPSSRAEAYHPFESKKLDVAIEASAGETFDDNVTFTKTNKKWDSVSELAVGLRAKYEGRQHLLDLKGGTVQQIFARESDFNNNAQDALLKYSYFIDERNTLKFKNTFRSYEDPRSFEEQFGRTGGRYRRLVNRADLAYEKQIDSQWTAETKYGNEYIFLSRDDLRDSYRHRGGFDLRFAYSTATLFSLMYEYVYHAFEKSATQSSADAHTNTVAAGVKRYFKKSFYGEAFGGADLINNFVNSVGLNPFLSLSLNFDLDDKTQFQFFKYETRSTTSTFQDSVFSSHTFSVALRRQVTKRLSLNAGGFYGRGRFEETDIDDDFFGAKGNLDYDISEDLKAGVFYEFSFLGSTSDVREYARNVTGIKIAYVFG